MTKYEGIPPKLVLLSLLAECCTVTLTSPALHSVNEVRSLITIFLHTQYFYLQVECLFLVLTHIGRDLMVETPGQMTLILSCLREAFLMADAPQQVHISSHTYATNSRLLYTPKLDEESNNLSTPKKVEELFLFLRDFQRGN